jgi:predicted alpha/beta superfamily hydrolase
MLTHTALPVMLIAAAAALALTVASVWAQPPAPSAAIRILVEDRSSLVKPTDPLPDLYIASSANGWNPSAEKTTETFTNPDGTRGWVFVVDGATARAASFEFKFTRGGWDTVEVDDQGRDIGNRRIGNPDAATNAAEVRMVVHGFVDQRGSRFAANPPSGHPETITGTVDVFTVSSAILGAERTIRVWTPPGYAEGKARGDTFPAMYFCDGQNMFSRSHNQFGVEWQADETADRLIRAGEIPALILVGIDHSGVNRAVDYNPPGTSFRGVDHAGDRYLAFVIDELMPEIAKRYAVRSGPDHTGLGGSSFGGNATIYAATARPGVFGRVLIESPALWLGEGALIGLARVHTQWPQRVFMAMGDAEYAEASRDAGLISYANQLDAAIKAAGLGPDRYRFVIEQGGKHHEDTWAGRFPDAMKFLWAQKRD